MNIVVAILGAYLGATIYDKLAGKPINWFANFILSIFVGTFGLIIYLILTKN